MTLLRHRDFRRLWAGDSLSQFGITTTALAMPLLAVRTLHASPFEVGLLTTFQYLAFLVIGLPAGAWVDRMRRRSLMITADLGRAALLGSIPLAALLGMLTLVQVYAVVLAVGCLTVFFDVSYQSYLPFLVGRSHLVEGNAKLQGTQSVAQVAGPSLGGFLVQALTAPYAILANVGTFLWSASWVGTISAREPRPQRVPDSDLLRETREGVAFIFRHPVLRQVAGATGTANLFSSAGQGMLIVLLARTLGLSAGVIGLLMAAGAAGGLLGAFTARPLARLIGEGPVTWISLAASSPLALVQPFLHRNWTLGLFVVTQIGYSAGVVIYNVTQVSFRQRLCPEHLLGRMNATMRFLVWGTVPLGGLLGGALGSTAGVRTSLLVAAIGQSVAFLWIFFSPLRSLREVTTSHDQERAAARLAELVGEHLRRAAISGRSAACHRRADPGRDHPGQGLCLRRGCDGLRRRCPPRAQHRDRCQTPTGRRRTARAAADARAASPPGSPRPRRQSERQAVSPRAARTVDSRTATPPVAMRASYAETLTAPRYA